MCKIRDRSYRVVQAFYSENPNVTVGIDDVIYCNFGDNNFYLEKNNIALDWSLVINAIRYGWVELEKVEEAE